MIRGHTSDYAGSMAHSVEIAEATKSFAEYE